MSTEANPHERLNRHRKATAIAQGLWTRFMKERELPDDLIERLKKAHPPLRRDIAASFGQTPPSEETWSQVVDQLSDRLEIYRAGQESVRETS